MLPNGSTAAREVKMAPPDLPPDLSRRRRRRQSSQRRAPRRRSPGRLYSPTCACARRWLSALTSVIEPISTDVCVFLSPMWQGGPANVPGLLRMCQLFGLQVQVNSFISVKAAWRKVGELALTRCQCISPAPNMVVLSSRTLRA